MRRLFSVLFVLLVVSFNGYAESFEALSYEYSVTVSKKNEAVESIVKNVHESNGLVLYYSNDRVVFRTGSSKSEGFISQIKKTGFVSNEIIRRNDFSEELIQLESGLKVKEEYLKKLYEVTETAELGGVLEAEKSIGDAVIEIERIKGRIKYIRFISANPVFVVNLNGTNDAPVNDANRSIWEWVNNLGIDNLVKRQTD